MFGYTGTYKAKISVMGSGMVCASIGIIMNYAYYGVEKIIRVGSCGAY